MAFARVVSTIKRTDRGLSKLKATFKEIAARRPHVKAGVLGKDGDKGTDHGDGLTNAQIAVWLEHGTSNQPPRPFIAPAFAQNRHVYLAMLRKLVAKPLFQGKGGYERALQIIGQRMASDMKAFVTQGPEVKPTNRPSTRARKEAKGAGTGEVRTLIDTGRVVNSITYAVTTGGK